MSTLERAYERAPRLVQNVAVSGRGWQLRRARMGPEFRAALAGYERSGASAARTDEVQQRALADLLDRMSDRSQGSPRERLAGRPITTKTDVLAAPGRFRLPTDERTVEVATGGSTGSPFRFRTTARAVSQQWAVWWRYRRWHGISLDTWSAHFGATPVCPLSESSTFWRCNRPGRQVQFSAPLLNADTVERYVAEINRRRLPWIHGLPSTIGDLASLMDAADLRLDHELHWVTFGAENVPDRVPDLVRSVLGVTPRQHYGQSEGVANFSECPVGRLHVDEDYAVVEFLPQDDPEGAAGGTPLFTVVGTALTNHAQAFVRYDTMDLVSDIEDGCGCGRPGRTVGSIDGRVVSFARLAGGALIGPTSHIFKGLTGVVQGQVFVPPAGGLVFHVVAGEGYTEAVAAEIDLRVQQRAPGPVDVVVETRPSLLRAANGKVPAVVQGHPPS